MLVVCSDTHGTDDHRLRDSALADVREADRVVHAGDFTTPAVFEAFRNVADRLDAVHGNADEPELRERLPPDRTLTYSGVRIAVTHTKPGGETALRLFGRQQGADLVVFGHTHRPAVVETDGPLLLNPGSHADPRGNRPGYAVLRPVEDGLAGEIRAPDGIRIAAVEV